MEQRGLENDVSEDASNARRGVASGAGSRRASDHRVARAICGMLILVGMLALALPAGALNQRVYPLQELIRDAESIVIGRVVAVDVPKMRAALVVDQPLKGQAPYKWLALNVAPGGWGHPSAMIRRLGPGVPVILFTARVKTRHVVLGFQNGTWFQMTAPDGKDPDRFGWSFTHLEVYLRRTYSGSTPELEMVLRDVLAGKREAPTPNLMVGPGMGPEVPREFRPPTPLPALPDFVAAAIAAPKSGGVVRKLVVRKLTVEEQAWVDERAKQFERLPDEMAMLLAQANYVQRDAQRALELERDHGRGGNRAWVRGAEEILDLKQRSDRLCWLDVRGVLMRAGEMFTPVNDPVDLIHGLRTKFSWDELDPMFDDDKWGRKKLAEEVARKVAARSAHPLADGDKVRQVLYQADFGASGKGALPMESIGWKPLPGAEWDFARRHFDWDGANAGSQRPGAVRFQSAGSQKNPLTNLPPRKGIPLAAKAGDYEGAALWFAAGAGDYEGRPRTLPGAHAYFDQQWVQVRQGGSRSFLIVAQVYTPDHTDEVGEPRAGWFYIRRPSRFIDVGIRVVDAETRTQSMAAERFLLMKVEPALDRFDRVMVRVDVDLPKQQGKRNGELKNEIRLTAFVDGIGEVARSVVDLNRARRGSTQVLDASDEGIAFTPSFGVRSPGEGYVPEVYLAGMRVQLINEGAVNVVRGDEPPAPPVVRSPSVSGTSVVKMLKGPRRAVIAVDTSSSMAPLLDRARAAALEIIGSLKPQEQFSLLSCARDVVPFAPDWLPATPENIKKATDWLKVLQATSGTNTSGALEHALAAKDVNYVVFVTDGGGPSVGMTEIEQVLAFARMRNAIRARIDAVLIAPAATDNVASRLAREHGGETRLR